MRAFADDVLAEPAFLHGLVNNAGAMAPRMRIPTADGFELQLGTNLLGHFALTNLLLPKLLEADAPRVATMSNGVAHIGRIRFDDLQARRRYSPWSAYGQSKLGNLLMSLELAALSDRNRSTAAHPGFTRTTLQSSGVNLPRPASREKAPVTRTLIPSQDAPVGTEPLPYAIADPATEQGAYYGPPLWSSGASALLPSRSGGGLLSWITRQLARLVATLRSRMKHTRNAVLGGFAAIALTPTKVPPAYAAGSGYRAVTGWRVSSSGTWGPSSGTVQCMS